MQHLAQFDVKNRNLTDKLSILCSYQGETFVRVGGEFGLQGREGSDFHAFSRELFQMSPKSQEHFIFLFLAYKLPHRYKSFGQNSKRIHLGQFSS